MSNTTNDLTIVIPAFRCSKYLAATIKSALLCEGSHILIAEDGSKDETLELARKWCSDYPDRISLIENSINLGMTANWQNALRQVKTSFCLKLDGDDIILPEYVHIALTWLRRNPEVGILAGKPKIISSQEYLEPDMVSQLTKTSVYTPIQIRGIDACRFILKWHPLPCSSSTFYRMDAWNQVGGFDQQLNWCSDQEIWFRVARIAAIGWYNGDAVLYRVHSENTTAKVTREDRRCYECDYMLTKAARIWPEAQLRFYFCWRLLQISKSYFASVLRSLKRQPSEIPYRSYRGVKCALKSLKACI